MGDVGDEVAADLVDARVSVRSSASSSTMPSPSGATRTRAGEPVCPARVATSRFHTPGSSLPTRLANQSSARSRSRSGSPRMTPDEPRPGGHQHFIVGAEDGGGAAQVLDGDAQLMRQRGARLDAAVDAGRGPPRVTAGSVHENAQSGAHDGGTSADSHGRIIGRLVQPRSRRGRRSEADFTDCSPHVAGLGQWRHHPGILSNGPVQPTPEPESGEYARKLPRGPEQRRSRPGSNDRRVRTAVRLRTKAACWTPT